MANTRTNPGGTPAGSSTGPATQRNDGSIYYQGQIYGSGGVALPGQGKVPATIGPQIHPTYHIRKALKQVRRTDFFQQMADTMTMPKNSGKEVEMFEYYPILDDRNINDQGIDATGAVYEGGNLYGTSRDIGKITAYMPHLSETGGRVNRVGMTRITRKSGIRKCGLFIEYSRDTDDFDTDPNLMTIRTTELMQMANDIVEDLLQKDLLAAAGITLYAIDPTTDNTTRANDLNNGDIDKAIANLGISLEGTATTSRTALLAKVNAADRTEGSIRKAIYANTTLSADNEDDVKLANRLGNYLVYESFSKVPVGRSAKTPAIVDGEFVANANAGTRSDNSYPVDNPFNISVDRRKGDTRELTLLGEELPLVYPADAYVIHDYRGGAAVTTGTGNTGDPLTSVPSTDATTAAAYARGRGVDGDGNNFRDVTNKLAGALDRRRVNSEVTFQDLTNLTSILNQNRVPSSTTMITGSTMEDTRTLEDCRVMYIGPQVAKLIRRMKDPNGNPAFISKDHYGAAASAGLMNGEIGAIDQFRFIVANEMVYWEGAGADVPTTVSFRSDIDRDEADVNRPGYYYAQEDGRFDVFPMLFVGSGSFTNIGFKSSMGQGKFNFNHKKPGPTAITKGDPYGSTGLMSVQWWMGSLVKRPEHIALINTIAPK
ncbi:MAG: N4-gp56 family major capsid protein [Gammaproteobacteria bacterium]|nr:N4-gp56 family major capsid protein [Gammaproteobacteria bacterium]